MSTCKSAILISSDNKLKIKLIRELSKRKITIQDGSNILEFLTLISKSDADVILIDFSISIASMLPKFISMLSEKKYPFVVFHSGEIDTNDLQFLGIEFFYEKPISDISRLISFIESTVLTKDPNKEKIMKAMVSYDSDPIIFIRWDNSSLIEFKIGRNGNYIPMKKHLTSAEEVIKLTEFKEVDLDKNWKLTTKIIGRYLYDLYLNDDNFNQAVSFTDFIPKINGTNAHLRFINDRLFIQVPIEFMYHQNNDNGFYLVEKNPVARQIKEIIPNFPPFSKWYIELMKNNENFKIKVLLIASNTYPNLDFVDNEIDSIGKIVNNWQKDLGIKVDITYIWSKDSTVDNVLNHLQHGNFHIIHFAGHSAFTSSDTTEPYIQLRPRGATDDYKVEEGNFIKLRISELQVITTNSHLQFFYLNSCRSAKTGSITDTIRNEFIGFAEGLSEMHVPAVLGFRWTINDFVAMKFAENFYLNLGKLADIENALLETRKIFSTINDSIRLSSILILHDDVTFTQLTKIPL